MDDAPLAPPPTDVDDAPLVSCICPTTPSRAWAFETAYASFCRQTYARTELLVFETGGDPSPRAAKTCTSLSTGTYDVGERELAEIVGLGGERLDGS